MKLLVDDGLGQAGESRLVVVDAVGADLLDNGGQNRIRLLQVKDGFAHSE